MLLDNDVTIATLRHLILTQTLRRGDGLYVIPDSRRTERLFGDAGRTKLVSAGIKLENLGKEITILVRTVASKLLFACWHSAPRNSKHRRRGRRE